MSEIKDYSFEGYLKKIHRLINEEEIGIRVEKSQIARKFCVTCATALPLPGYTIMTPPCGEEEDKTNREAYNTLLEAREQLFNNASYAAKCVYVSENSLHMTLADLVSKHVYVLNVQVPGREGELIKEVKNIFDDFTSNNQHGIPEMSLKGLSLIPQSPSSVTAIVGPKTPKDYMTLVEFRRYIHDKNPTLIDMGVTRKFSYVFHITLAHIEGFFSRDEGNQLKDKIFEVNKSIFHHSKDIPFKILSAELRKFDDVSRFDRDPDVICWPVVHFNKV